MSGSGSSGVGTVGPPNSGSLLPKILLAKPGLVTGAPLPSLPTNSKDDTTSLRSRVPSIGSLSLFSDSWDFHFDRFLPFLTDNTDFTVVGVIGPPGVGKSTIMNHLYGFDASSPGMLPPYAIQSEDVIAMSRHSSLGIEPRVSSERLILLDTQPVFSPSVMADMMRPDGSSTIPVLSGESLSAELAHEILSIQLGVLLMSVCHIVLVVSEGVRDHSMWRLMSTVDLLKHGIPDPSLLNPSPPPQSSGSGSEKESKDKVHVGEEYIAAPIFVHTKLRDQDLTAHNWGQLQSAFTRYFSSSSFIKESQGIADEVKPFCSAASNTEREDLDSPVPKLYLIPAKNEDDSPRNQYESFASKLWRLRDQVLSMDHPSFSRAVTERDWLKNSAKIWEQVKSSTVIAEYSKTLQSSGLFRR